MNPCLVATYRLQLRPGFGFAEAREVLPYLAAMGVSHIYASPIFKARPGSTHGYDVCDQRRLNPELGGDEEFEALMAEVKRLGLGWIQDIVPNHMAVSGDNRILVDVLENGPASSYFDFFDIDWDHPLESIKGRMLAPFLGTFYGQALEGGEIRLGLDADGFFVSYYELRLPLRIDSYATVLTFRLEVLRKSLGRHDPGFIKLMGVLYTIKTLPAEGSEERYAQITFIKAMLFELHQSSPEVAAHLEQSLALINGEGGGDDQDGGRTGPERFDFLDRLLGEQYFRLSFWKVAGEEINYRRFFSINDLISLRAQDEKVFALTHRFVLPRIASGDFAGLRVDHIDGLYDPTAYLRRLRDAAGPDCYLAVEKILTGDEPLPAFWPVQGTTGYDFLNQVLGLMVRRGNEPAFNAIQAGRAPDIGNLTELVVREKRAILERHMAGDVDNMARMVNQVSSKDRHGFDITLNALRRAIAELVIHFPVYRTYISSDAFRPIDLSYVRSSIQAATRSRPDLENEFAFLKRFLLLEFDENLPDEDRQQWMRFVMNFQQVTGPLMAKGLEDTAFYVYNRLLCLNEVGGDPRRFGLEAAAFHDWAEARFKAWPLAMNATATHDTKRGEDARARLAALSETPRRWRAALKRFARLNARKKRKISGAPAPDRNEELFIYQSLLASWPPNGAREEGYTRRFADYLVKSLREAKEHTNWLSPNREYEAACLDFAASLLRMRGGGNAFLTEFEPLARRIAALGAVNSLCQLLIKAAAPGVPDFYQGSELMDLSMVDPDNRRPVDFRLREKLLKETARAFKRNPASLLKKLMADPAGGRAKLFLTSRLLAARKADPELFLAGGYLPLAFTGSRAANAFGFARTLEGRAALAVVPRFVSDLGEKTPPPAEAWENTALLVPEGLGGTFREAVTGREFEAGEELPLGEILAAFPVALLLLT